MRLFLAIDPPDELRHRIAQVTYRMAAEQVSWWGSEYANWVPVQNLHITLRFIGEVDSATTKTLANQLREMTPPGAASLSMDGLLLLPPRGPVRVVAQAVTGDQEALGRYRERIDDICDKLGLPSDGRAFKPHLTLARMRRGRTPDRKALMRYQPMLSVPNTEFVATECVLYQSTATPSGQVYAAIERFPLE